MRRGRRSCGEKAGTPAAMQAPDRGAQPVGGHALEDGPVGGAVFAWHERGDRVEQFGGTYTQRRRPSSRPPASPASVRATRRRPPRSVLPVLRSASGGVEDEQGRR